MSEWSTAAMSVVDESGKTTRAEHEVSLEFKFPDRDDYKIIEIDDLLQSKSVRRLPDRFGPPHPPVDFIDATTRSMTFAKVGSKTISVRDYYSAALVERAKYPSGLAILMERIAQLEDEVSENGKPAPAATDCLPHGKNIDGKP